MRQVGSRIQEQYKVARGDLYKKRYKPTKKIQAKFIQACEGPSKDQDTIQT